MSVWSYDWDCVALRLCSPMIVWLYAWMGLSVFSVWPYDRLTLLLCGHIAVSSYDWVAQYLCVSVVAWPYGCFTLWLCGPMIVCCFIVWPCYYMARFLYGPMANWPYDMWPYECVAHVCLAFGCLALLLCGPIDASLCCMAVLPNDCVALCHVAIGYGYMASYVLYHLIVDTWSYFVRVVVC